MQERSHCLSNLSCSFYLLGVGLGCCLQLLLELQFLESAMPTYAAQPAIDDLLSHCRDILVAVVEVSIVSIAGTLAMVAAQLPVVATV